MTINPSTTIVDLAFNLSGSLAGIPVILPQLPVGEKIGFATIPELWEDVDDIGQTWTPELEGVETEIEVITYNPTAVQKAPYTTDISCIGVASDYGNKLLEALESDEWVRYDALTRLVTDNASTLQVRVFNPPSEFFTVLPSVGLIRNYRYSMHRLAEIGYEYLRVNAAGRGYWNWIDPATADFFKAEYVTETSINGQSALAFTDIEWRYPVTNDYIEKEITFNGAITAIRAGTEVRLASAPVANMWAFGNEIFVKAIR